MFLANEHSVFRLFHVPFPWHDPHLVPMLCCYPLKCFQRGQKERRQEATLPALTDTQGHFLQQCNGAARSIHLSENPHSFQSHWEEQHAKCKTKCLCSISPLRGQHHRIPIETVDVIMAPPRLLGIHTQGLAVHHLVQNLWSKSKWTENVRSVSCWDTFSRKQGSERTGGGLMEEEQGWGGAQYKGVTSEEYSALLWPSPHLSLVLLKVCSC